MFGSKIPAGIQKRGTEKVNFLVFFKGTSLRSVSDMSDPFE